MTEPPLARHDLVHPDGRAFHFYGDLRGDLEGQPAHLDVGGIHLRRDVLTDTWVVVSPARNTRPGGDQVVPTVDERRAPQPQDEVTCPLCPGGPELPFHYDAAVFDNRFPALSPVAPSAEDPHEPRVATADGRCQVVVYTSEHEGSLSTLEPARLAKVVAIWRDRTAALWASGHRYVMAFENHGPDVGATLSHPHGQIYAVPFLPPTIETKLHAHTEHRRTEGGCLGCALVSGDAGSGRVVAENESFSVAVPFAGRWPFEVQVRLRRHGAGRLADLSSGEALDLARAIRDVTARYDGLFGRELPYMLGIQEAPDGAPDWHLHVELLPPHRDAHRLKVRASVETVLGVFLNDTRPEDSAERLSAVSVPATSWDGVAVPTIAGLAAGVSGRPAG